MFNARLVKGLTEQFRKINDAEVLKQERRWTIDELVSADGMDEETATELVDYVLQRLDK